QARTNLRQLLHHLRRALPPECQSLAADNQTVQWRSDASCAIDVVEFEAAAARAAEAEKHGDLPSARKALELAAQLHHDDLLPGPLERAARLSPAYARAEARARRDSRQGDAGIVHAGSEIRDDRRSGCGGSALPGAGAGSDGGTVRRVEAAARLLAAGRRP